jgi:formylglycine-generating enzyme required for sulfatase activity
MTGNNPMNFFPKYLNPNFALEASQQRDPHHKMMYAKGGFNPDRLEKISARFFQSALWADFVLWTKSGLKIFFLFIFLTVGEALSSNVITAFANNLEITNFSVKSTNTSANIITFTCDVDWDNSWRTPTNFDAVWVFLKYSTDGGLNWAHASAAGSGTNPDGFSAPTNFEMIVPADEKGFFLQRTDLRSGAASAVAVEFVWDYGQDGISDDVALASNTVNKIFGIEMVYIPQGPFYAGDGNSSSDYRFKQGSADDDPWYIQNENAITTTNSASDGYYYQSAGSSGENASGDVFSISQSFPKGYRAFYQMKYELTEEQWAGFLNTLSAAAKTQRDITASTVGGKNSDGVINRNTVSWDSASPNSHAATSRPDRPVSYISWPDLLAYADWAALRPMSELEYEKSARGIDVAPVADEYAWGKATYNQAEATEIYPDADEDGTEQINDGGANLNRNSLGWTTGDGRAAGAAASQKGPLRVGIFAESSTNRTTSGAGYYGTMELSGNLAEMAVTIGNSEGRGFLGTHGDGVLTVLSGYEGNATNDDWPGIDVADSDRGVTGTSGSGYRGGDFQSASVRHYQISTRAAAAKDPDINGFLQRYDATLGIFGGGRLNRTAP